MNDHEVIEKIVRAWYHDTNWPQFGDEVQRILRESGQFDRFPKMSRLGVTMPERRTMPIVEHHEVFITLTSTGQPLIWSVDEFGHVAPLEEREVRR